MITGLLLAMLGTALVAVLVAMVRAPSGVGARTVPGPTPAAPPPPSPEPQANPLELDAWDARKGDVVSIAGAAEDFADLDFPVDRRGAYEAANHRWLDLTGQYRGRQVNLEIYRYPEAQILGLLDSRRISLPELGVTEDQLADLDAKQDPSQSLSFEGKTWKWQSSREIRYFENETGSGEGIYRWLFVEQNGSRVLCVEKRESEPFEVRIARKIEKRDVTVYRS